MKITGFAICMHNQGYSVSLELHKVYGVVSAYENDPDSYLRVVDESGEDYLYPADWFESVHLGPSLESRLLESIPV